MKAEGCDEIRVSICGDANVTIDWGDGVSESKPYGHDTLHYDNKRLAIYLYTHTYSKKTAHTVTITSNSITHLGCSDNNLT
jgi:hypothetical protein